MAIAQLWYHLTAPVALHELIDLAAILDVRCLETLQPTQVKAIELTERQGRLRFDKEVPYRHPLEKQRSCKKRARPATFVSRDELAVLDKEHDRLIDEPWADFRQPVDYAGLERLALAAIGPEGNAYLDGLSDSISLFEKIGRMFELQFLNNGLEDAWSVLRRQR